MNHNFVSMKTLPFQWLIKIFFPKHSYPYDNLAFVDIFSLNIFTIGNHLITDELYNKKLECVKKIKTQGRIKYLYHRLRGAINSNTTAKGEHYGKESNY